MPNLELLPCPFCGEQPKVLQGMRTIMCVGEDCFGPVTTASGLEDASVQWNKRAPCTLGELTCDQQFALAQKIAANVGYVLVEEPPHPDSPHALSPEPTEGWKLVPANLTEEMRDELDYSLVTGDVGTWWDAFLKEHGRDAMPLQDRVPQDIVKDAARYRRLQVLGCAPCGSPALRTATVLRFTNLDAFVDEDMKWNPSRGEAHLLSVADSGDKS